MEFEWWYIIPLNWIVPLVLSYLYIFILLVTDNITYEGIIYWRSVVPILRFRLSTDNNWYTRLWRNWYGFAMMLAMIHRDEKGSLDDKFVEKTIVHELRHNGQILILGFVQWILYMLHNLILLIQGREMHKNNWFENDARRAADRWLAKGRPKRFNFGKRY